MLCAFPMGSNPTAWNQLHHNPSESLRKAHIYTYTFPLETNQNIGFAHRVQHRLRFKSCCTMLSLKTSQVKNMNTYVNYQDLTDFIETSFHKREGNSSLSRDCKNIAKVTRITCQMVLYFLSFFFFYVHLAVALTGYVNQNPMELHLIVYLIFIYIIILQKEHFSFVLDVLRLKVAITQICYFRSPITIASIAQSLP